METGPQYGPADEIPWDGVERRGKPKDEASEGILGPEYHHSTWDGVDRRGRAHEMRIGKVEVKLNKIEDVLDEHGEMLRGMGESLAPLASVVRDLSDWARVFGSMARWFMSVVRWLTDPHVWKALVLMALVVYYLRNGNLPDWWRVFMKAMLGT